MDANGVSQILCVILSFDYFEQIGSSVSEFEKVFEDMEVKSGEIDDMMNTVYQG